MSLKENGKVFTSKFVGTGPSSFEKRICRGRVVSERLRNAALVGPGPPHYRDFTITPRHTKLGKML